MTVLVTDDSLLARKSLIKVLSELEPHAEFIEAGNGLEAVEYYKAHSKEISVVFLDLTMPVMDGFGALEAIMGFDANARVVIVSADIQPKSQERVMALGAKTVIPKPISLDKMRNLLLSGLV